jgi:hypothetical protein
MIGTMIDDEFGHDPNAHRSAALTRRSSGAQ